MSTAPQRYRKRPGEIEAMQWTGENAAAVAGWTSGAFNEVPPEDRDDDPGITGELWVAANSRRLPLTTGEWVLHDAHGFYPCKPDIFAATYEGVQS